MVDGMNWLDAKALHIFSPDTQVNNLNWVEQILGDVVLPLLTQFGQKIEWIWLTRYMDNYNQDNPPVGYKLTDEYKGHGFYRYVVFRCSVDKSIEPELHLLAQNLAKEKGYFAPEWLIYNVVDDLGNDRFAPTDASSQFRQDRAHLVVRLIDSTVRLMLHSLIRDEKGMRRLEKNVSPQNPNGSIFESLHHLFCNASGVPINVLVSKRSNEISFQTYWMGDPYILKLNEDFDIATQLQY
jgi:hypothetical protein